MDKPDLDSLGQMFVDKIKEVLNRRYPSRAYDGKVKTFTTTPKNVTGGLVNAFSYEVTTDQNGVENGFIIYVNGDAANYWRVVDEGRRPNNKFPPLQPIKEWIQRKPVQAREINGRIPTLEQRTFLIARSIATLGIRGIGYLERAQSEIFDELIFELGDEYADYYEDLLFNKLQFETRR